MPRVSENRPHGLESAFSNCRERFGKSTVAFSTLSRSPFQHFGTIFAHRIETLVLRHCIETYNELSSVYFNVSGFKKKIAVLLIVAALGNGALIVRSVGSAANETASDKPAAESNPSLLVGEAENGGLFEKDSRLSNGPGALPGQGEFFLRAMLAIFFVVALGIAAIYVSKKLLPRIATVPGKEIRIVETVHLGPRKAVHLIDIGHRRFLIGSTNETVTKLADLHEDFAGLSVQEANSN